MEYNENNENNNDSKKVIIPAIIAVLTLTILTVGATFAFFSVNATATKFTERQVTASADSLGSVALSSGSNLSMSVSAVQMMKQDNDVTYYASSSGTKVDDPTTETIGTAAVEGAGTFTCTYDLTVSATGSNNMYTKFQSMTEKKSTGQIVLTVNNGGATTTMDFNEGDLFPKTISGTMTGLRDGSPKTITAQLKLVNSKTVDQTDLAGTDITISFNISNLECKATA